MHRARIAAAAFAMFCTSVPAGAQNAKPVAAALTRGSAFVTFLQRQPDDAIARTEIGRR